MKRLLTALLAVGLLGALATPAAARPTGIGYACDEYAAALLDAGRTWTSHGVEHVRGQVVAQEVVGDALCAGTNTVVVNYNLNLATSTGVLWGTATLDTSDFDGGFMSSWTAKFTATDPLAPDAQDIWVGQYIRHGFGELAGWQARGDIFEKFHWLVLEEGFAFNPGD
jgi:hypothetical protein